MAFRRLSTTIALIGTCKLMHSRQTNAKMAGREWSDRTLSLPKSVAAMGMQAWNDQSHLAAIAKVMKGACKAETVEEAIGEVHALMSLGHEHDIWAYYYLRTLSRRNTDLYYSLLACDPSMLLPVAYTPTVGEGCQKFGRMPFSRRGCYVSITDRGNVRSVLREYAYEMLEKKQDNPDQYDCQCIVFSDGGRILGLGDLGTFGMGIPIGKLDLYTVCGGFNPNKTIPVMIDAGCADSEGNTAKLLIRDHEFYTGLKQDRVKHKSEAGTLVNSAYYGDDSFIGEFMTAATELFGEDCLLQFEDFNSNDAFPLLAEYRNKFLCYNDDIQGTAAVAVAAVLGGIKIQNPTTTDLVGEARKLRYLFHGAGSANIGGAMLLTREGGVPPESVFVTNSRGLVWKSEDGKEGSFRNEEQKGVAVVGDPGCGSDLISIVKHVKPDVLIGAVGRVPNCFTENVIKTMMDEQQSGTRPIVFALSNPKTQAEITAHDCYTFSSGKAIFGSGTRFDQEIVNGEHREPGQVNNFFIFPGMSFGAMACHATCIPEKFFMVAAEAVANSLNEQDIEVESVVPHPQHIREVALNVATAVVLEAQKEGLATKTLGANEEEVAAALKNLQWTPTVPEKSNRRKFHRTKSQF